MQLARKHLASTVDPIKGKLLGRKVKLLSFQARVALVKFSVASMMIYNMSVCRWLDSVNRECKHICRNFTWTGITDNIKLVTLKWETGNKPFKGVGHGLRKMEINLALLMKIAWVFIRYNSICGLYF